uniref:Uncharacterized protein n=1 Tax=Arundo donax TaxID=35708 RepID=A0A0A9FII5_ARUDO
MMQAEGLNIRTQHEIFPITHVTSSVKQNNHNKSNTNLKGIFTEGNSHSCFIPTEGNRLEKVNDSIWSFEDSLFMISTAASNTIQAQNQ